MGGVRRFPEEFHGKLASADYFLSSVMNAKSILLKGSLRAGRNCLKAIAGTENGSAARAADPFMTASQRSQEGEQLLLLRGAQVSKALSGVVCFTIVALDCVV
jgi:hypothetical protein